MGFQTAQKRRKGTRGKARHKQRRRGRKRIAHSNKLFWLRSNYRCTEIKSERLSKYHKRLQLPGEKSLFNPKAKGKPAKI